MLTISPLRNVPGDLNRRWMSDEYFDRIVRYDPDGGMHGFQLCYDKGGRERALAWTREEGYSHCAIDTGEGKPTANHAPVLKEDRCFAGNLVKGEFNTRSAALPTEIRDLVLACIDGYRLPQGDCDIARI